VCDACALSPISMREGPSLPASALPCSWISRPHETCSPRLGAVRAWVRFAQKTDEEIRVVNAVAISMAGSLAIAAIAPNGEMGRESVADANGT
jgi:hypothetical protein